MNQGHAARSALVVGGGLGGLAAAVGLHRAGWQVRVVERATSFGEVSAGATVEPNGLAALDALGLGEQARQAGQLASVAGVRTPTGRWLHRAVAAASPDRPGPITLGIHRATLHRILREALPREALIAAAEVVGIQPGSSVEPAEVELARAGRVETVRPGLVVAADGLHSSTRRQLWPDTPAPMPTGTTVWRGILGERSVGSSAATIQWGRGAEFGTFPVGEGRIAWYAAAARPAGERGIDEAEEVRNVFGQWAAPAPAVLAATDRHTVLREDLYVLAADLPSYVTGRVALLGDAAHPLPPALGQGVSQALEDAVALGRHCAEDRPLGDALQGYHRERRPRVEQLIAAARRGTRPGRQHTTLAA